MPEIGQQSDERTPSLPFGLYFGAKEQPHWSHVSEGKDAGASHRVEKDRRIRQIAGLNDTIHQLKDAVNAIVAFDRNGMVGEAAENLHRTAVRVNNRIDTLLLDIADVQAAYSANETAATVPEADLRPHLEVAAEALTRFARGDTAPKPPTPADVAAAAERGAARWKP